MPTQVQRRRGTTTEHSTFTGAAGELTVDTTKKTVVVHDGTTAGGFPLARAGANSDITSLSAVASINTGQLAGMRNKIINGRMGIDQRNAGAAQTITAAAALAYTVDRWYAYCTGANVTGQRVAGTAPNDYNYRFSGAASVTKIGFAQRMEAANTQDLAGTTATLAVDLANSLLTTVTWTAWYASTADTFGTLASPTRTQIATGTFTVTSALTRYNAQISIPSAATTGIEVELSVGAQTSGTWTIGRVQLEVGSVATPFEHRPYGAELALCQRYYEKSFSIDVAPVQNVGNEIGTLVVGGSSSLMFEVASAYFAVRKRGSPTITTYNPRAANANWRNGSNTADSTVLVSDLGSTNRVLIATNNGTSQASGTVWYIHWTASAEL